MATSQDHKARDNDDKGPNTGGMGAYSPAPVVTPEVHDRAMNEVILPTLNGMAKDGMPYTGFLYAGLMIDPNGHIKVLEFNCRFGDPETQPIMLRLKSDLVDLCLQAIQGTLNKASTDWDERPALGVVMAAGGYPFDYHKGDTITGLPEENPEGLKVFHAGTDLEGQTVKTSGGRVLCVTALGADISEAQKSAYELAKNIQWNGAFYRTDIGHKAIRRN